MNIKTIASKNNWKLKKISDVTFYQEGPGVRKHQYQTSGVKLLNVGNLQDGKLDLSTTDRYISKEEAFGRYSHFLVDDGDLIIACSGIKVEYFEKKMGFATSEHLPLCMNTSTMRFKALDENKLDVRYLAYYLKTNYFKKQIQRLITGSAQLNFGPSHIRKVDILIPPLETQKKIVEVLDKAQELIHLRKEQIKLLDDLIQSVFYDMFGDPVTNSKAWEIRPLNTLCTKIGSGATPRGGKSNYKTEGISLIRSMNVHNGFFKYDQLAYIDEFQAEKLKNVTVEEDDVLINITGASVARACIVPKKVLPARVNQHVSILRPIKNIINSSYLKNLLVNENYQRLLMKIATSGGATREAINKDQLKELSIPVSPIKLQNKFAEKVEKIEKQKQLMKQSLTEMENNFKSLMQRAFKGELFN